MGNMVAAAQAIVPPGHRIAHHIQIITVAVAREGGGWRLEIETLRDDGGTKADAVHHAIHGLQGLTFPPESSRSAAKRTFFEHELTGRIDSPVVTFPGSTQSLGQLDEALVE